MFHGPLNRPDEMVRIVQREGAKARRVSQCVHKNSMDIERLLMITEALWTIVKEERGLDDDQLLRRIIEIDMRDEKYDGKVASRGGARTCPSCDRPVSKRRPVCLYCGKQLLPNPFAR